MEANLESLSTDSRSTNWGPCKLRQEEVELASLASRHSQLLVVPFYKRDGRESAEDEEHVLLTRDDGREALMYFGLVASVI